MVLLNLLNVSPHLMVSSLVLLVTYFLFYFWKRHKNLPPGPWGLPVFGYYPFLSNPHEDFNKIQKVYGNVFSLRTLGGSLLVVVNGAKLIKDVLVNRADEFSKRPPGTTLVTWASDGVGISQEDGLPWKEQRKFFLHNAKNFGFGKIDLEPQIQEEIQLMIKDIWESSPTGCETDVEHYVSYLTNTIICKVLFNKKLPKKDFHDIILPSLHSIFKLFVGSRHIAIGFLLELDMMLSSDMKKIEQGKRRLMKLSDDIVDEHIKNFDPDHSKDFVDACLQERHSRLNSDIADEGTFTIQRIKGNAYNLFLEGTESTGFAITNLLLSLSKHRDVQATAQKELDNVIGKDRLLSWNDRPHLPYLEATIQELFRTSAPFLITTMYSNPVETTIEGFQIPQNSIVIANLASVHFDSTVFANPLEFNPNRFLSEEGKRIKLEGPYPFGVGKRQCIGESLAQMEVFLVVGSFLQMFTMMPGSEAHLLKLAFRNKISLMFKTICQT